ncbi:MAG: M23 family metallopeptidase [Anaerolineaceae bacterium]|nr:M23 family metallopeptidase [Anaerolineaceae bacterium]
MANDPISLPTLSPAWTYPHRTLKQASPAAGSGEFMQLLTGLMSMTQMATPASSEGGMAGIDLMSPVLISLIEQLISSQVMGSTPDTLSQAGAAHFPGISGVAGNPPSGAPVYGPLTQNFHPGHNGLDFGVVVGTPARATMDGKVVHAGWNEQGYGNLVILENGPYRTYYAHLSEVPVVMGQVVHKGEVIGLTGNTGHSTGPHIHYEVRENGQAIDPTSFTLPSNKF